VRPSSNSARLLPLNTAEKTKKTPQRRFALPSALHG
jgi:hypothetical protein